MAATLGSKNELWTGNGSGLKTGRYGESDSWAAALQGARLRRRALQGRRSKAKIEGKDGHLKVAATTGQGNQVQAWHYIRRNAAEQIVIFAERMAGGVRTICKRAGVLTSVELRA